MSTWDVREINELEEKEEVVDIFRKGNFELFDLTKTKLKRNGEVSWCEVNGIIAGVQEIERAREVVAVLMKDEWYSVMTDFGCVSSKVIWVKFKFSLVKICVVVKNSSTEEAIKEMKSFLNYLDRVVDRLCNEYRLCMIEI